MGLESIELDHSTHSDPPREVSRLLEEAERRIDDFFETERNRRYPLYLPSNPKTVYGALDFITREDLPLGRVFCEWGSGFGVVACLAAALGYEAYGIEIEPGLVALSEELAQDLGLDVRIINSSYVPDGFESYAGMGGEEIIRPMDFDHRSDPVPADLRYDGMDRDLSEVDVFFIYARPGDEDFMQSLFDAVAVEGALLILYDAQGEISLLRKIEDEPDNE